MSEADALQYLLQRHRRSSGLNDFIRICLGLELEPFLKAKARTKRQAGGQNKGSSILTEAERLDVRKEIARIAGVSVGNITKVKQLTTTAHSDIIKALQRRELSIHRAWLWSKLSPEEQGENLWLNQSRRGIGKTIRHLLSPYLPKNSPPALNVGDLIKLVSALQSGKLASVRVVSINVPGKAILVTEELFRTLEAQEELAPEEFVATLGGTCSRPLPARDSLLRPTGAWFKSTDLGCCICAVGTTEALSSTTAELGIFAAKGLWSGSPHRQPRSIDALGQAAGASHWKKSGT